MDLIGSLEASNQFRRDTRLGRIFHPGTVSYREVSPTDSLHVIIDGNRVSAHIDERSPLNCNPEAPAQYSWLAVAAHNIKGMAASLGRRLRGRHGDQRCNLDCEIVWVDDDGDDPAV